MQFLSFFFWSQWIFTNGFPNSLEVSRSSFAILTNKLLPRLCTWRRIKGEEKVVLIRPSIESIASQVRPWTLLEASTLCSPHQRVPLKQHFFCSSAKQGKTINLTTEGTSCCEHLQTLVFFFFSHLSSFPEGKSKGQWSFSNSWKDFQLMPQLIH